MSNYVLVLDTNRQPLAPCHPARARELLRKRKAAVFRRYPFTIILNYVPPGPINNNFELRLDPGSKTTGIAVVSKGQRGDRCVIGINLHHRGEVIKRRLTDRAMYRRGRRGRKTRYRPARFLNRARPKGWLPPSVYHRVLTTHTWIDRLTRWCPITSSREEIVKFDTHKLANPDIVGKDYQRGALFNTAMREYLLKVYNHTCQYCHGVSGDKILEWEHKVPKSRGGSNSVTNATLSCKTCNNRKGNYTPEEWLRWIGGKKGKYFDALRKHLPKVIKGRRPSMKDAAVMNAVRYRLGDYLAALGLNPQQTPGWMTKRNRLDQHYRKDHWIDAACVGNVGSKVYIPNYMRPLSIKAHGHTRRRMVKPDKYGFPKGSPKGPSRVFGFKTGDVVRAVNPKGKYKGVHVGRVVVKSSGWFDISKVVTNVDKVTKLHAKDGYNYRHGELVTWHVVTELNDPLYKRMKQPYIIIKRVADRTSIHFMISLHTPNNSFHIGNKQ